MMPEEPPAPPPTKSAAAEPRPIPAPATPAASSDPEGPAPMLDVHPLHRPPHGWRDFLVHIATIAVGLLLALALEQLATYVHHRFELATARHELALEAAENEEQLNRNLAWLQTLAKQLEADLALLRAPHPPPGTALAYTLQPWWPADGAWRAAERSGSIGLMPHAELARYAYLHDTVAAVMEALPPLVLQVERIGAIAHRSPDGALTAKDVEELTTAISETQARLDFTVAVLNYEANGLKHVRAAPAP